MAGVPFSHLYNYIKNSTGKAGKGSKLTIRQLSFYSGVSESSINHFLSGKQTTGKYGIPKERSFRQLFDALMRKYYIPSPEKYRTQAERLILDLTEENDYLAERISAEEYAAAARHETPPSGSGQYVRFLQGCALYRFVWEYIEMWLSEEYRSACGQEDSKRSVSEQRRGDVPLTVRRRGSHEVVFDTDNRDYAFFRRHPLSLLSGPCGAGKTLFLRSLADSDDSFRSAFDRVIYLPLVYFTTVPQSGISADGSLIADYLMRAEHLNIYRDTARTLLMLDGYNEYRAVEDACRVNLVTDQIWELVRHVQKGKLRKLSLILTARDENRALRTFPAFAHFEKLTVEGREPLTFEGIAESYREYDKRWLKRANQRIGIGLKTSFYNKCAYFYVYELVLPYLAFRSLEVPGALSVTRSALRECGEVLNQGCLGELMAEFIRHREFPHLKEEYRAVTYERLFAFLDDEADILRRTSDGSGYEFASRALREYLAAKFLYVNIRLKKQLCRNKELRGVPVTETGAMRAAARFLREALGLNGTARENYGRLADLFMVLSDSGERMDDSAGLRAFAVELTECLGVILPSDPSQRREIEELVRNRGQRDSLP